MGRLYANQLDEAILARLGQRGSLSRAEVAGLFPAEPIEAIGRALQRLARQGKVRTAGFRASTTYTRNHEGTPKP